MSNEQEFQKLLEKVRQGDDDAASEIFRRYARRLIGLAHKKLDGRLRQKVDAEDVVQSVFKSFFVRIKEGEYDLSSWESLWSLLVVITIRKCGRKIKYWRTQRRDVAVEVTPTQRDDDSGEWETLGSEPTPSEAALLTETLELVMGALSERDRLVLEMSLRGHDVAEIAVQIGRSKHTVYEVLDKVKKKLLRLRDENNS